MACGAVDGTGHGGRGWPARAGAGWGAASGGAAANPGCPPSASASVTPDVFGAATKTARRASEVHNKQGNVDVDNNTAVGHVGERAAEMLDSSAGRFHLSAPRFVGTGWGRECGGINFTFNDGMITSSKQAAI